MYEQKMDAQNDYNSEVAYSLYEDGEFDDLIIENIMDGTYDTHIAQRIMNMMDNDYKVWNGISLLRDTPRDTYLSLIGSLSAIDDLIKRLKLKKSN